MSPLWLPPYYVGAVLCCSCDATMQAEQVKEKVLAQRAHWRLNGPFNGSHLTELLECMEVSTAATHIAIRCP